MSSKNLFRKPFDEGTRSKLEIFEDYFKEWLPVFISKPNPIWKQIQVFDLFAGEGTDLNGVFGSPLRIIKTLNDNKAQIKLSGIKITLVLNEFNKEKFDLLKKNISEIADPATYETHIYCSEFKEVFDNYYPSMTGTANFLFLDQNGIKQITESVFKKLTGLVATDILFFISSSYIKRFADVEDFNKYLKITKQHLENKSYYHIHRIVLEYYRSLIDQTKEYFLAPFSIKKSTGIYGLIFGSNHTYGMEKFLSVCWRHDKLTGEANFDIDSENIDLRRPSLFAEMNIPNKRQMFEKTLEEKVISKQLKSNYEVYTFTLNEGFLFKDCNVILKSLRERGKISFTFKLITSKLHKESPSPIKIIYNGRIRD